jgi:L-arabinose isomerase
MFNRTKPKVGFFSLGLSAYWPQFPGMRERLVGHGHVLGEAIAAYATVIDGGLVDTIEGARACAAAFRAADVDLVFCHLSTYSTSEALILAVRDLAVPVVLLNVQSVPALSMADVNGVGDWLGAGCTCAGLPEMTAVLARLGKRFDIITGHLSGDETVSRHIEDWCSAAGVRRRLNTSVMGMLGRPYPGMTDLYVDETAFFSRFGTYTKHLNWDDIGTARRSVTAAQRKRRTEHVAAAFRAPEGGGDKDFGPIADALCALDRLVEEHGLFAIPNHYESAVREDHAEILAVSNPAFSILMAEGIACPVEADIKTALAMTMLKQVAASATLAELYSMDFNRDTCIIGHSGAADLAVARTKPQLVASKVFHGKSGGGYLTQLDVPVGRVTLLSLTQAAGGAFRLVAAEGDVIDAPVMRLGDTNCHVRFSCGLRTFVNRWASFGPTHHGVLATGGHIERIQLLSKLFDIPLDLVCQ